MNNRNGKTDNTAAGQTVAPSGEKSAPRLVREGFLLTTLTIIGKISGYIRELTVAYFFGTSIFADAYRIAVDLSHTLYHLVFGNQVETSLIPILTRWRTRGRMQSHHLLVRLMAWGSLGMSVLIAVLLWLFASVVTRLQVPGYSPEDMEKVTLLIRWIAPSIPLHVTCFLIGYLLGSVHRFRVFAALPIIVNFGLIFGAVMVGTGILPTAWLSLGYSIGALIALVFLIWDVREWLPHRVRATSRRIWTVLKPFLLNYWPLLVLSFVTHLRIFIDKRIVSDLGVGSVAALYYARFIVEAPGITAGLALIRIMLPRFSEMVEMRKTDKIGREFMLLLETSMWILLPGVAFLAASAQPVVTVLFAYGQFGKSATDLTSLALLGAAPALWTGMIFPLVNRVFNAQGRNEVLLGVGIIGAFGNIALAYVLAPVWGVAGVGLALGVSQFAMILYLIPKLPGNITLHAMAKIALWWILAGGLYIVLQWIPCPSFAAGELVSKLLAAIAIWLGVSLLIPAGREQIKRIIRVIKRLGKQQ